MTNSVPIFPSPKRDLDIDLSIESFSKVSDSISEEVGLALARTASFVDSKQPRAAAAELERLQETIESSEQSLKAPVTGLRAGLRLALGDPVESERLILAALSLDSRKQAPDPLVQASMLNNLGIITHRYYQKPATAEERFGRAIEILSELNAPDEQRLSRYHRNLGIVRDSLGDFDGAASAYRNALARTGDDPVIGLNIVENLARNREISGHVDEAESYIEAAFLNLRSWRGEYPRLFMRACDDLNHLLLKKGDFAQLRGVAGQQAAVCLTLLPVEEHWRAVQPLTFVALAQWLGDELFEAGATLRHIASLRRQTPSKVAVPAAIVGGIVEMYDELKIDRRTQAIKNFQNFAAKLSF